MAKNSRADQMWLVEKSTGINLRFGGIVLVKKYKMDQSMSLFPRLPPAFGGYSTVLV